MLGDINAPYRGLNIVVSTPDEYLFELQIHTPQSFKIKQANHILYEEKRLLEEGSDKWLKLDEQMLEKSRELIIDENVNLIESFDLLKGE
ncbi:MAG: hypothetical protein ACK5KQ_02260 [Anaerorhabdus sp.]